jgi:hypothetical protein
MRWIAKLTTLWIFGISLAHADQLVPVAALPAAALHQQALFWPWLALAGILVLLASIALGARRCPSIDGPA